MAAIRDDDVYGRTQGDSAFLQRVRDAHDGRWDALDALWWESHPLEVAPSGIPAPAAELRELQRRLFSESGDAGGDEATTAKMRELEATIAGERAAIKDAVERAQESQAVRLWSHTDAEVTRLIRFESAPEQEAAVAEPAPVLSAPPVRRNLAVVLSIAAALVGGVVLGTQLSGGTADATPPAASTSPQQTSSPVVTLKITPLVLAIFDRPQEPADIPSVSLPDEFKAESFRALDFASFQMQGEPVGPVDMHQDRFFAARTLSNLVCLVGVVSTIEYVSTCTLDADFPATGLRLYWPGTLTSPDTEGNLITASMERYTVWKPDGSFEGGGMGR